MDADGGTEAIETRLLLEAIHEAYGYDFRGYAPDSIARRVRAALSRSGLAHLGELQHRLLVEPAFFASLLDDFTVRVSGFFRDPGFFRAFRELVVPTLRAYPRFKVWHAGCAGGEEAYTMAILLLEEDLYDRATIYATDVSTSAVSEAKRGAYPAARREEFARGYADAGGRARIEDYFTVEGGRMVPDDRLRRNLVFFQHDLVADHALGEMNVILCRNVLIYFGSALRERVLGMFSEALRRGGFLCLGNSECVPEPFRGTFVEHSAEHRIYRKEPA